MVWLAGQVDLFNLLEWTLDDRMAPGGSGWPIVVTEFGTDTDRAPWWQHTIRYVAEHPEAISGWAYWAIDGAKHQTEGDRGYYINETYGLLLSDYEGVRQPETLSRLETVGLDPMTSPLRGWRGGRDRKGP